MATMDFKSYDDTFRYQLLSRLQMDCDYYLGHGNRSPKHLWSDNEADQIKDMKTLHATFDEDKKPDWLSLDDIAEYEKQMITLDTTLNV